jgi:hypothetical protein
MVVSSSKGILLAKELSASGCTGCTPQWLGRGLLAMGEMCIQHLGCLAVLMATGDPIICVPFQASYPWILYCHPP